MPCDMAFFLYAARPWLRGSHPPGCGGAGPGGRRGVCEERGVAQVGRFAAQAHVEHAQAWWLTRSRPQLSATSATHMPLLCGNLHFHQPVCPPCTLLLQRAAGHPPLRVPHGPHRLRALGGCSSAGPRHRHWRADAHQPVPAGEQQEKGKLCWAAGDGITGRCINMVA